MGYYSATPAQMRRIRAKIDNNPQGFSDMIEQVLRDKDIHVVGEQYQKRFPSNYEGLLEEIYNYRNIYFQKNIAMNDWGKIDKIKNMMKQKILKVPKSLILSRLEQQNENRKFLL